MERNLKNSVVFGVCDALSKKTGIDVLFIRLIFVIFTFMGMGLPIMIYLALTLLTPIEK